MARGQSFRTEQMSRLAVPSEGAPAVWHRCECRDKPSRSQRREWSLSGSVVRCVSAVPDGQGVFARETRVCGQLVGPVCFPGQGLDRCWTASCAYE